MPVPSLPDNNSDYWSDNLDVEFQVLIHLIDVAEDVADDARNDAFQVTVAENTLQTSHSQRGRHNEQLRFTTTSTNEAAFIYFRIFKAYFRGIF